MNPLHSQDIDPETLKSIMDLQGASQAKSGEREYKSFTQNNYSNTMRLLDEFDQKKEEALFFDPLDEINLAGKLLELLDNKDQSTERSQIAYNSMKNYHPDRIIDSLTDIYTKLNQ